MVLATHGHAGPSARVATGVQDAARRRVRRDLLGQPLPVVETRYLVSVRWMPRMCRFQDLVQSGCFRSTMAHRTTKREVPRETPEVNDDALVNASTPDSNECSRTASRHSQLTKIGWCHVPAKIGTDPVGTKACHAERNHDPRSSVRRHDPDKWEGRGKRVG
jgi:hypothetical protein